MINKKIMKKNIFILIHVTYDHFRFQNNIFASTDYDECYKFAKDNHKDRLLFDYDRIGDDIGIYESNEYDKKELSHLWIQKL